MAKHHIGLGLCLSLLSPAMAQVATEVTIVLEPVADTSLFEEGELSNGAGIYSFTGTTAMGNRRRALVRYDFSQLPGDADVSAAMLSVTVSRTISSTLTVRLHRVTTAWGEAASDAPGQEGTGIAAEPGDATWTQAVTGQQAWATPGGDFVGDASASLRMRDNGTYEYASAGLTSDVIGWLNGSVENHGWILISNEGTGFTTAKRLNTREHPDAAARPRLSVTYASSPPFETRPVPLGGPWLLILVLAMALGARSRRQRAANRNGRTH